MLFKQKISGAVARMHAALNDRGTVITDIAFVPLSNVNFFRSALNRHWLVALKYKNAFHLVLYFIELLT